MFSNKEKKIEESKYKEIYNEKKVKNQRNYLKNQILKKRLEKNIVERDFSDKIQFKLDHLDSLQNENLKNNIIEFLLMDFNLENIDDDLNHLNTSDDIYQKHFYIIKIRKLIIQNPKIVQKVIDNSLLKILEFAVDVVQPHLQLEANWILTNICSISKYHNIINLLNKGLINIFISTLQSNYSQIIEQAIWGIGNLSSENSNVKNFILKNIKIQFLFDVFEKFKNDTKIYDCFIWIFSNLCNIEDDNYDYKDSILEMRCILIDNFIISENEQSLQESLYGLVHNSDIHLISKIATPQFLNKLKMYFNINIQNYNKERLHLICKILLIISMDNQYDKMLIDQQILKLLNIALSVGNKPNLQIFLIINNLSLKFGKEIIAEDGLSKILTFLNSENKELSKNALWIICSLCVNENGECMYFLLNTLNVIEIFKNILLNDKNEDEIYVIILQAVIKIFTFFKKMNQLDYFRNLVVESNLAELIENFQKQPDNIVYVNALFILENFFENDNFTPTFENN